MSCVESRCRHDPQVDPAHHARDYRPGGGSMNELWAACPFCNIINGQAPATILETWDDAIAIEPLNPVVHGHVLIIPRQHVRDYLEDPYVSAATMRRAAQFGNKPSNIITSAGREATQTVQHLHIHIVPRRENDGLALPWPVSP